MEKNKSVPVADLYDVDTDGLFRVDRIYGVVFAGLRAFPYMKIVSAASNSELHEKLSSEYQHLLEMKNARQQGERSPCSETP